ncbi:hypothetical protein [Microbulbifer halophilus]|uniref:DUF4034 domain-containing protein n=1 Tax=Microbulbifer halophilus TaxID=453963 RepID=A0ABW5EGX9_9GAMM|nr:hypothetical protein [Microbulbifer halophilus]MCW8128668.1 hypothetical protein [Microbulbifer halophilus]
MTVNHQTATPVAPIRIATLSPARQEISYFFNGHYYYAILGPNPFKFVALPWLDEKSLKTKECFLGDDKTTIIGTEFFEVPLRRSKRIGKDAHNYFKVADEIYSASEAPCHFELQPHKEIDARSLKVLDEDYAVDKDYYFSRWGARLPAHEVDYALSHWDLLDLLYKKLPPPEKQSRASFPHLKADPDKDDLDMLSVWLMQQDHWQKYAADPRFYPYWRAYFKLATRLYEISKDASIYQQAHALAEHFQPLFVVEPASLEKLSELYQLADAPELYAEAQKFLADLQPENQIFTPAIAELLEQTLSSKLVQSAPVETVNYLRQVVLSRYQMQDKAALKQDWEQDCSWFVDWQTDYFQRYVLTKRQSAILDSDSDPIWKQYQNYKHYSLLNPLAHLQVANGLFITVHHWHHWTSTFFDHEQQGRLARAFYIAEQFFQAIEKHGYEKELLEKAEKIEMVWLCGGLNHLRLYCQQVAKLVTKQNDTNGVE